MLCILVLLKKQAKCASKCVRGFCRYEKPCFFVAHYLWEPAYARSNYRKARIPCFNGSVSERFSA